MQRPQTERVANDYFSNQVCRGSDFIGFTKIRVQTANNWFSISVSGAGQSTGLFIVRFGSLADITASKLDVRFTPESGHSLASIACPLYVIKGIDDSAAFQGAIITEPSHSTPLVLFNCR